MSLLNQYASQASSEYEYRRMMEMLAQQQMVTPNQYMGVPSLSACLQPAEPSPVLLLLPKKAA